MVFEHLQLEPCWSETGVGSKVNALVATVVFDPLGKKHLVRTLPSQKLVLVSGKFDEAPQYSLLNVSVVQNDSRVVIDVAGGFVLPHQVAKVNTFHSAIEVCAGIGCMSQGLDDCGIQTKVSNELRKPFCSLMCKQGKHNVIEGDLGKPETLAAIHAAYGEPAWLTSGFSCQPWSLYQLT